MNNSYPHLAATTASPPSIQWTTTQRQTDLLCFTACLAAISAAWIFFSAIPSLLAFKRSAESLERLLEDAAGKDLPEAMAAVRLSGIEVTELTAELSGVAQELTRGVRSSTRVVQLAEERLRPLANIGQLHEVAATAAMNQKSAGAPLVVTSARAAIEGIVKAGSLLQSLLTVIRFLRSVISYFRSKSGDRA